MAHRLVQITSLPFVYATVVLRAEVCACDNVAIMQYALSVLGSSKAVSVTGCAFKDLSGGFLKLGSVGKDNTNPDESSWDEGFSVTQNVAHNQAVEYGGAPGYFGGWIAHSTISHNTVSDAGYR